MVRISRADKRFVGLATPTLAAVGISERYDLQEYIFNSPEAFRQELRQDLMIINKEVQPSEVVADRIDLLALDRDGNTVIIELKRGSDKLHLLQAIGYAGMIAKWSSDDLKAAANDPDLIEEFTGSVVLNQSQRIVPVAEAYDYEVLAGAEWLYQKGVEIDCVRVALAVDGSSEYLTFTQIFPTPELAEQARKRGARRQAAVPTDTSWEEALADVKNDALVKFFERHLNAGAENKLRYREIDFLEGKIHVHLRAGYALVVQWCNRFPGDVDFWRSRVSAPDHVSTSTKVRKEDCVRFRLSTAEDFAAFEKAIDSELKNAQWVKAPADPAQTSS